MSENMDDLERRKAMRERSAIRRGTRGSIFFPIILVAVGVVILLYNVGVLSGSAWESVLSFWPVILIAIGLDSLYRREGMAGAVFWIGLGTVFLLSNLGLFAWNVWEVILNLWPVLLIAIGLDLVIGRRSTWGAVLAMVLLIAILAGALWFLGGGAAPGQAIRGEEFSQVLGQATAAEITLKPAVGEVQVAALPANSANLIEGRLRTSGSETARQAHAVSQGKATFSLRTEGMRAIYTPGPGNQPDWDLRLNSSIPLELEAGLGAGELTLDLTGLQISRLDVELGVGQARVILPAGGDFNGEISGAIGEIVLVIPEGAQVRIETNAGLATVEAPDSFARQGDVYTTQGYDSAEDRIELKVSQAIGKITLRR